MEVTLKPDACSIRAMLLMVMPKAKAKKRWPGADPEHLAVPSRRGVASSAIKTKHFLAPKALRVEIQSVSSLDVQWILTTPRSTPKDIKAEGSTFPQAGNDAAGDRDVPRRRLRLSIGGSFCGFLCGPAVRTALARGSAGKQDRRIVPKFEIAAEILTCVTHETEIPSWARAARGTHAQCLARRGDLNSFSG
eukprot:scaffold657_cov245-Pinguiococcus_pyrenoidosus.AAC.8